MGEEVDRAGGARRRLGEEEDTSVKRQIVEAIMSDGDEASTKMEKPLSTFVQSETTKMGALKKSPSLTTFLLPK